MWGKHVQNVSRRLIKYQLTTSLVATLVSIIGGVLTKAAPFSAAQLLWLNLLIDCVAAVALALEVRAPHLLPSAPLLTPLLPSPRSALQSPVLSSLRSRLSWDHKATCM